MTRVRDWIKDKSITVRVYYQTSSNKGMLISEITIASGLIIVGIIVTLVLNGIQTETVQLIGDAGLILTFAGLIMLGVSLFRLLLGKLRKPKL